MTTLSVKIVLVLDSIDPDALAPFWCAALRYRRGRRDRRFDPLGADARPGGK
ncbi:MAG: hypothetical protein QM695_06835 [Micropruina sp.]